jgi:hypothetical protein
VIIESIIDKGNLVGLPLILGCEYLVVIYINDCTMYDFDFRTYKDTSYNKLQFESSNAVTLMVF